MKEVKLKERLENAFAAFFDDEKLDENDSLNLTNYETNSTIEKTPFFSETTTTIFNIFKQVFLFLPANFILYFMSIAFTAFFLFRPFPGRRGMFMAFIIFLIASFMTVLGLGNWREPKHYLIPLSTISIGIILGIVGSIFFGNGGFGYFMRNFAPYFIPLAFIAPVLVKGWVDRSDELDSI
jgi:hypothetical protein